MAEGEGEGEERVAMTREDMEELQEMCRRKLGERRARGAPRASVRAKNKRRAGARTRALEGLRLGRNPVGSGRGQGGPANAVRGAQPCPGSWL